MSAPEKAAQLEVSVGQALVRLRAYAFGNDRPLTEVAEQHERLGERGEDPRPGDRRAWRHRLGRHAVLRQRPIMVAEGPRNAAQELVQTFYVARPGPR